MLSEFVIEAIRLDDALHMFTYVYLTLIKVILH